MRRPNVLMVPAETVMEQAMFLARMALGDAPDDGLAHPFGLGDAPRPRVWRLSPDMFERLYAEALGIAGPYTEESDATMVLLGFPVEVDDGLEPTTIRFEPRHYGQAHETQDREAVDRLAEAIG